MYVAEETKSFWVTFSVSVRSRRRFLDSDYGVPIDVSHCSILFRTVQKFFCLPWVRCLVKFCSVLFFLVAIQFLVHRKYSVLFSGLLFWFSSEVCIILSGLRFSFWFAISGKTQSVQRRGNHSEKFWSALAVKNFGFQF